MELENYFLRFSQFQKSPTVYLFDRGAADPLAYLKKSDWY